MKLVFRVPAGAAAATIGALFDYSSTRGVRRPFYAPLGFGVYELRVVREGVADGPVEIFVELWTRSAVDPVP